MHKKSEIFLLVLLAAMAFGLNLIYVSNVNVPPQCDAQYYDNTALTLTSDHFAGYNNLPLYPLFLAGVYKLFGHDYLAVYILQALMNILSALMVYFIAKRAFGQKAAFIALLISFLYVDYISFTGTTMAEIPAIFIFLIVVTLIFENRKYFLIGIFWGLLILTKSLYVIMLPALVCWITIFNAGNRAVIKNVALLLIAASLVVLPWTVRNYREYHAVVPFSPQFGIQMLFAHNPMADGGCNYDFTFTDYGKFLSSAELNYHEKDVMALKLAVKYIVSHPFREFQLLFLRFGRYWSFRTHFDFYAYEYPLKGFFFAAAIVSNALLYPLAFLGMVFYRNKFGAGPEETVPGLKILPKIKNWIMSARSLEAGDKISLSMLILVITFNLFFLTLLVVYGRMHLPLLPIIIIFASHGATIAGDIVRKIKDKELSLKSKEMIVFLTLTAYVYLAFIIHTCSRFGPVMRSLCKN